MARQRNTKSLTSDTSWILLYMFSQNSNGTAYSPVCTGGGTDLPTLTQTPNFLKIRLCNPILRVVDFLCMSITVLSQKTRASYVPRFNFGGLFFDKKYVVQIANVKKIWISAKNNDFSKKSQGYSFQPRELCF